MPSIVPSSDAPGRRADARRPGASTVAALALSLWLLGLGSASAQRVPCLPSCDPMDPVADECCPDSLAAPCAAFLACQDENHALIEDCINTSCKVPSRYAECDRALACSRKCALQATNCSIQLRSALQTAGSCSVGRGAARRACNRCFIGGARVCAELLKDTTIDGSSCQRNCIRQQPWIQECYAKCDDRCANDRCAVALCRRSCRDSICDLLKNTCSPEGDFPPAIHEVQRRLRKQYDRCCEAGGCEYDDESTVACESTTTTSTSSTSSSSSTTIQATTTTIRGTTTTLAPTP